jgi:hypothetical protein
MYRYQPYYCDGDRGFDPVDAFLTWFQVIFQQSNIPLSILGLGDFSKNYELEPFQSTLH